MGTWGAGLYDDDIASDLRDAIKLVAKIPAEGDRLLVILREMNEPEGIDDIDDQTFWLVVADQFERRGIRCDESLKVAMEILDKESNLATLREHGADDATLRKRRKVLEELMGRLKAPRPTKPRRGAAKPPEMVLASGQVFAFPAEKGWACSPWRGPNLGPFQQDGWGTLVVLATGRVFDWLPWCAVASLATDPARMASLVEAKRARLIFHLQTEGAARCVPHRAQIKEMDLRALGTVELDQERTRQVLSRWDPASAVTYDWAVSNAAMTRDVQGLPMGPVLATLLAG